MKPEIKLVNAETGEEIIREMTNEEFSQYQEYQARIAAEQAERETKTQAKELAASKLLALGLTTEDLQALGLQNIVEEEVLEDTTL
jgi:hypothetical protein